MTLLPPQLLSPRNGASVSRLMQDPVGYIVDLSYHLIRAFIGWLKFRPLVSRMGQMVQSDLVSSLECSGVTGIRMVVMQPVHEVCYVVGHGLLLVRLSPKQYVTGHT
jgi:hypothetical protein